MQNHSKHEALRPKTDLKKAIPLVLLAAFFNALMIMQVKLAAAFLPTTAILFARYLLTLIIILPFVYFNSAGESAIRLLKTNRLGTHLIRDCFGSISVFCYFYAAKSLSLADATVLFCSSPLFIPLVAFFWGRLKIIPRLWWGMGLGYLGIIVILHPGKELFQPAAVFGLFSGLCAAIVYVGSRYLSYTEPPLRNMFYYFFIGTLIAWLGLLFSDRGFLHQLQPQTILFLLGVGLFGYLYQLCFTHSTRHAPVRLTSSFLYTGVIFSLIADWLIWHIVPDWFAIIGISLIILGTCLLLFLYPHHMDYQKRNVGSSLES